MEISFRPHHFLCALCFQGRGYSPTFVSNFLNIMAHLNSPDGGNTPIQVVAQTDSICSPCPHRKGPSCSTEDKIAVLDNGHAKALQIKPGDTLTWDQAKEKIARHIDLATFHHICATCEWKALGICENVIRNL